MHLKQRHFINTFDYISLHFLFVYRGLRDKLIEDERLELAMNISTKCGIDPSAVWSAWGMAKLRVGNYLAAREKFSKCLKVCCKIHLCI